MIRDYVQAQHDRILEEFIEKYFYCKNEQKIDINEERDAFEQLLVNSCETDQDELETVVRAIAKRYNQYRVPYIVLLNEVNYFRNAISNVLLEHEAKEEVFTLFELYRNVDNIISNEYLQAYIVSLLKSNKIRINSLNDMVEKQFIIYYQHHLEWLSQLAEAIQQSDRESIPELDAHLCHFGQWLDSDAKPIIMNNSKYKEIVHQHQTLHGLGETIAKQLDKKRYDQSTILSYLEKSEMISLTIGTELALIDNTYLIKKAGKDEMTGALNRNSLSNLFASQYELSLATESNFSLAMCDLDHFKGINDTYGHLAGDNILKAFVKIVQETLRDSDVVVRYGGEEFIIILPHTKLEHAIKKLEDLRLNFANHVCNYNDMEFGTTVSIGVIEITPQPSEEGKKISMESYIKEVDELLYHSKTSGRNRITC